MRDQHTLLRFVVTDSREGQGDSAISLTAQDHGCHRVLLPHTRLNLRAIRSTRRISLVFGMGIMTIGLLGVILPGKAHCTEAPLNKNEVQNELDKMRENFNGAGNGQDAKGAESASLANVERLVKTGPSAVPAILNSIRDKNTPSGMRALLAEEALRAMPDKRALAPLGEIIHDKAENTRIRRAAISAIGKIGGKEALRTIASVSEEGIDNQSMQVAVMRALGDIGDAEGAPMAVKRLGHKDPYIRIAAANALLAVAVKTHNDSISAPLVPLIEDKNFNKRGVLINIIGRSHHREAIPALARILRDPKEEHFVRWSVIRALGDLGGDEAVNVLISAFDDKDELVKAEAIEAAVNAGLSVGNLPLLEHSLQSCTDKYTRDMLMKAIDRLKTKAK